MKRNMVLLLAVLAGLSLLGCSREKWGKLGKADDACYPGKPAKHAVDLDRVSISDKDFHLTSAGDPFPVRVYLTDDEEIIASANGDIVGGTRGERDLNSPVHWDVNFDTDSRYQIIVEEQTQNGAGARYIFPDEGKTGFWPVPANEGTFKFGRGSFVHFTDRVVESSK